MGHALVAAAMPGTDVVHKVSIIPRGIGALGYTIRRPTEDRYLMTRAELEASQICLAAASPWGTGECRPILCRHAATSRTEVRGVTTVTSRRARHATQRGPRHTAAASTR